jgi:hypothetical protein
MNPITHLLAAWTLADNAVVDDRDRGLVTWAGVLPDIDGLGFIADKGQVILTGSGGWHYTDYHHQLLHGLPGALLLSGLLAIGGVRRARVFAFGFLAVHLHLLCDFLGSRGPTAADIWPIWYLAPFSQRPMWFWQGQWPLNAWPNALLTVSLLAYAGWAGVKRGHTPVALFSLRADSQVVAALRLRFGGLHGVQ